MYSTHLLAAPRVGRAFRTAPAAYQAGQNPAGPWVPSHRGPALVVTRPGVVLGARCAQSRAEARATAG
jgi:hypothetical protein